MFDHLFVPGWDGPSVPLSAHKRTLRLLAAVLLLLSAVCFCLRGIRGRGDLTLEMEERQIPLFYQTDPRWGGNAYGDSTIAVSGCGPTCLSMVICGLTQTQDWGPASVAAFAELANAVLSGRYDSDKLLILHTKKAVFHFDKPVTWTRDGEAGGEHQDIMLRNYEAPIEFIF